MLNNTCSCWLETLCQEQKNKVNFFPEKKQYFSYFILKKTQLDKNSNCNINQLNHLILLYFLTRRKNNAEFCAAESDGMQFRLTTTTVTFPKNGCHANAGTPTQPTALCALARVPTVARMPTVARKWQERPTAIIAESTLTMQKGRQASAAQEAKPPRTSKVIEVRLAKSFGKERFRCIT